MKIIEIINAIDHNLDDKEIASLRTKINRYIKRKKIQYSKNGKALVIPDAEAEKIIANFKEEMESTEHEDSVNKTGQNTENLREVINAQQETIAVLKQQLEEAKKRAEDYDKRNKELNDKIADNADEYKDLLKRQQELTARSQELEHQANQRKAELDTAHKQHDEDVAAKKELEDRVDKYENASFWQRLTGHFD